MTRWKIDATALDSREKDFTASFTCHNMDTGAAVDLTVRQDIGHPASDMIGALTALAQLMIRVANDETEPADPSELN